MLRRFRSPKGFTLIELLIVIAIIGIIAALLIPNFLDSLQKARQKNTMATLRNVGTAMMARITDEGSAAAAGQDAVAVEVIDLDWFSGTPLFVGASSLSAILVPQYIQTVPARDSWKQSITWVLSLDPQSRKQALGASCGRDGVCDSPWPVGTFFATDYDQDIVWSDGQFARYPSGTTTVGSLN
jgi:prepilin-type N-terminal cleavage/methylation domain-containing protein